jgi:hypothetical protein
MAKEMMKGYQGNVKLHGPGGGRYISVQFPSITQHPVYDIVLAF